MVTAGTYRKAMLFNTPAKLDMLMTFITTIWQSSGWQLEAWSILGNHYHLIAVGTSNSSPLARVVSKTHTLSAKRLNEMDNTPGRKTWFQFWDTPLTFQRSYLARLKYVHFNPVKHSVSKIATDYPWCSASGFIATAAPGFRRTVLSMPDDKLNVPDDF
ncbi:MAG: transposase [Opitutaceae bacterium]